MSHTLTLIIDRNPLFKNKINHLLMNELNQIVKHYSMSPKLRNDWRLNFVFCEYSKNSVIRSFYYFINFFNMLSNF